MLVSISKAVKVLCFCTMSPENRQDRQFRPGAPLGELIDDGNGRSAYFLISRDGWDIPARLDSAVDEFLCHAGHFPLLSVICLVIHCPGSVMREQPGSGRRAKALGSFVTAQLDIMQRLITRLGRAGVAVRLYAVREAQGEVERQLQRRPLLQGVSICTEVQEAIS